MRFIWIFILTLMAAGVRPTDGNPESWGFSQLLSLLGHSDNEIESDPAQHRAFSRHKRAAPTVSEYILDVEISIPDPSLAVQIKEYLTTGLSFPLTLGGDTNITRINVTTSCNQTGSEVQCSCESGYLWSSDVCQKYTSCSSGSVCNCIKGTSFPSQYCQPVTVNINLSLKIKNDFTPDLQDPNSPKYKEYKTFLENQFNTSYKSLSGFKSATITRFRPGSVIADYTVVTEPTTPGAMSSANSALINDLSSTNYTALSINTVVSGWGSITVSPGGIVVNDTVNLTCRVNVTSFTDASWYINDTQKISNTSYTTTIFPGGVQSVLKIDRATFDNSGTYACNIDVGSTTYTAEATIQVGTLELNLWNSVVTCNNSNIPIIRCCTKDTNVTFNLTCQNTNGNIAGFTLQESSSLCPAYYIQASPQSCSITKSATYSCTCKTKDGGLQSQNVAVTFEIPPMPIQVSITSNVDQISEWNTLTLTCKCGATNVDSITWSLIQNGISTNINAFYVNDLPNCISTLTVPNNSLSVNWNGTFKCQVNGNYSANKTIGVFRRARASEITIEPVQIGFSCNSPISFSCSVDDIINYKSDATRLNIYTSGSLINTITMTASGNKFSASYIGPCSDFQADCTFTNLINDNATSNRMTLTKVSNVACNTSLPGTSIQIGVGEANKNYTVPCTQLDPNQVGNITYTCDGNSRNWIRMNDTCVSKALNNLYTQVQNLNSGLLLDQKVPDIITSLNNTVNVNKNATNGNDIQVVVNILQQTGNAVIKVEEPVMAAFLDTVSVIVGNTSTWSSVPNKTKESSNLLQSVESFAGKLDINGTRVNITSKNVQLLGSVTSNSSSNFTADFDFSQVNNLTGNVLINQTILNSLPNSTRVVSIAYPTLKDIIGVSQNSTSNQSINGLVMTTVLSSNYTQFKIGMQFKKSNSSLNSGSCVWWDFTIQDWNNSGCKLLDLNDSVSCLCDHLTSFSILMSTAELPPEVEVILSYITYIGVGISMFCLLVCIIVEATVWKSVTKNKTSYLRHVCIMNIAVTLLMADIWFIIGAAMNTTDKVQACITATFFSHLFYLCVFFWMFTMGLILFYRLMCVFHDLSKTTMMGISFFLGYGCPIIIAVITVAVTQPRNIYHMSKKCWLNIDESKAFLAFVVPAFFILFVNLITLVVVIIKVLRPSVGDKPKKEEKSSLNHIAKCILILTPLLGLTWGFGIGTMVSSSTPVHGIFAALNSLQGLFILIFGCLMDKKVRDALFSRFSISRWSSQQTKTSNLSSTEPAISKGVINLFAKKGVYNISSAQVNTSSDLASSNSYSLLT